MSDHNGRKKKSNNCHAYARAQTVTSLYKGHTHPHTRAHQGVDNEVRVWDKNRRGGRTKGSYKSGHTKEIFFETHKWAKTHQSICGGK